MRIGGRSNIFLFYLSVHCAVQSIAERLQNNCQDVFCEIEIGTLQPSVPFLFVPQESHGQAALAKGGVAGTGALKILVLPRFACPPPPYPNPGTLVDLTTKVHKCDSRHFDDKSA